MKKTLAVVTTLAMVAIAVPAFANHAVTVDAPVIADSCNEQGMRSVGFSGTGTYDNDGHTHLEVTLSGAANMTLLEEDHAANTNAPWSTDEPLLPGMYTVTGVVSEPDGSGPTTHADEFMVPECPVEEPEEEDGADIVNIKIITENNAIVENGAVAGSNTGGNHAGGSKGGNGGNGGNVNAGGEDSEATGNGTGSGGNGGNGGMGGAVGTGAATAVAGIHNTTNDTDVEVDPCACEGTDELKIRVRTTNNAIVGNGSMAGADTGYNAAKGSRGGHAGNGGTVNGGGMDSPAEDNTTGSGGAGGNGGAGGAVGSGPATSISSIISVVGRTILRIR